MLKPAPQTALFNAAMMALLLSAPGQSFETEAEAIEKANNSVFGLSASVWTHDVAQAQRIARALRSGTVWINDHNKLLPEAETGGFRQSGLGRLHGFDAFADFTELKHIYQAPGVVGAGP